MLSSEGMQNFRLLKSRLLNTWKNDIVILDEKEKPIPVDAFEIQMIIYGSYRVMLEYETGTFALKIWTGERFEYLDGLTSDKIFYGFDSMIAENIQHNCSVLDKIMRLLDK